MIMITLISLSHYQLEHPILMDLYVGRIISYMEYLLVKNIS